MKNLFTVLILCMISQLSIAQCYPDRHSTSSTAAWLSCEASANPNAIRGNSHWIMYDLQHTYELSQMTIWNYNETSHTNYGLRDVVIDYSMDGETWIEWGSYTLEQSIGSSIYEGDLGPDLGGIFANYVLITAESNYGGDCYGLSELKFKIESSFSDVDEQLVGVDLALAPVPADQQLSLDLEVEEAIEEISYSIINMQGQLVARQNLTVNGTSLKLTIGVSDLPSGQYIIAIQSDQFSVSRKISVVHP